MKEKIEELEKRIQQLETLIAQQDRSQSDVTVIKAPLRILDEQGKRVADIGREQHDTYLRLYNSQGTIVASLGADGTHSGYVVIRNRHGKVVGYLDVEEYGARLQLCDNTEVDDGGVAVFGGGCDMAGGGVNINGKEGFGSISLWADKRPTLTVEDAEKHVLTIGVDSEGS